MSNSNSCINPFSNQISNLEISKRFKSVRRAQSKNKYLSFDESIHKTLSEFNMLLEQKEKQTLRNLNNLLEKNWIDEGYESDEVEQKFKIRAYCMLASYYNDPLDIGVNNLIINKNISQKIDGKTLIFTKVDKVYERIDGGIEIVDYKSGYVISHQDNFTLDFKSAILLELVRMKLGTIPNFISYYYLSYSKKFTLQISEDVINSAEALINDLIMS
jgi:hypothetical protein